MNARTICSFAVAALMLVGGRVWRAEAAIPPEYQQLSYIEMNGTQYFDTGVVPAQDPGYELDFKYYTTTYVDDGYVFGTAKDYKEAHWTEYDNAYCWGGPARTAEGTYKPWEQKVHTVVYNRVVDNAVVLDGQVLQSNGVEHYATASVLIGRRGSKSTFKGYIYAFAMINHQSGEKVIDYIPARRLSDQAVGFYDAANNAFVLPAAGVVAAGPELGHDWDIREKTIPDQPFTGSAICPQISIVDLDSGEVRSVPDADFTVRYSDNTGLGVAMVAVSGFEKTKTLLFRIVAPESNGFALEGDFVDKVCTPERPFAGVPGIRLVDRDGAALDPSGYEIGYVGAERSGSVTAYARITSGQYAGTVVPRAFTLRLLPSGYQLLDSLEFNGTQYFDTGVIPEQDPGYELDFRYYTTTYVNDGHVFGTVNNYSQAFWTEYDNAYNWGGPATAAGGDYAPWEQKVHTVVYNRVGDNAVVLDGLVLQDNGVEHYATASVLIGRRGSKSTFKGYVYSFEIVNHLSEKRVIDYLPVRRLDDDAVGFYDFANDAFRLPAAGTVSAGPDVAWRFHGREIPNRVFTGSAICPPVSIEIPSTGEIRSVPDADFAVRYSHNTGLGIATVTVTGLGMSDSVDFKIVEPVSAGLLLEGDFGPKVCRRGFRFAGIRGITVVGPDGSALDPALYSVGFAETDRSGAATAFARITGGDYAGKLVVRTFPFVALPSDYRLLDWVELDGSQYFDTGVIPRDPPGYEVSFDYYTTEYVGGDGGFVFGTAKGYLYASWTEYNGKYVWGANGGTGGGCGPCEQKRHSVVYNRANDNAVVLDGVVVDDKGVAHGSTSSILIGKRETGPSYKGRVYSFSVRSHPTGSHVAILVPAIRKSDGAVGFYDGVRDCLIVPAEGKSAIAGPVREFSGLMLILK